MRISIYTFCEKINGKYYIYSSLSNSLCEVTESVFQYLVTAKNDKCDVEKSLFSNEFYNYLVDNRFLIENEKDNILLYKAMIMPLRAQTEFMHLTIAPTMDCNFRCFYCFEHNKCKGFMPEEIMDGIVKHVEMSNIESLYLTWFGGEPLLAMNQMKMLYRKLKEKYKKKYKSNIVTTGFYLSQSVISELQKIEVSSVQITLDGNKESHNKIKRTNECVDVFSRIIQNVDLLTDIAPEIEVSFRVNITKQNMDEYVSLYDFLTRRYMGKNVVVSPAMVMNRNITSKCSTGNGCFLSKAEMATFVISLWDKYGIYTPQVMYPDMICNECAIRDRRSISFDPNGFVYKCWEHLGDKKYSIAKIDKNGLLRDKKDVVLNRLLYGADPLNDSKCLSCEYLPVCDGGCPIQRIQNEFEGTNHDVCTCRKGFMNSFLRIHLECCNSSCQCDGK